MEGVAKAGLLERDAELDALRGALDEARYGRGRLVVLEGAAGIGKTSLLRATCAEARAAGAQVLRARGTELERDFPFALVRQLFEPALAGLDLAARDELLGGAARLAGPVVGVELLGGDSPPPSAAALDPSFATLNALFWLTSNLVEAAPAVLAIDDAHWADEASLRYLRFVLPRLEDLPLLLILAERPGEPGAAELLAEVTADPAADVLRPSVLTEPAVAEMVRDALGVGADEAFCAACGEATGGNPFLLTELLLQLREDGSTGEAAVAPQVREIAPAAIRRSVLIRLGRLPAESQRLARAIAILGDDADAAAAAEIAGIDEATAAETIDALAAAGVLAVSRPLHYRHPLLRTAVYADVPPAELATAHARAAAVLAERGATPERIALHLLATEPAGNQSTVRMLAAAADRALARAAPEAALRYLERALAEPADDATRPRLMRDVMTAVIRSGLGADDATEIAGDPLAELAADDDTLLASAWQVAMGLMGSGRGDEVEPLLDRAATVARERGELERALSLESLIAATSLLSPARAQERFARYGDAVAPGTAAERLWLALQAWWGAFLGRPAAESAELARRAVQDGRIFGEQPDLPVPGQAILVLARAEEMDFAMDRVAAITADARGRGSVIGLGQASYLRAYVEYLQGDIAACEADVRSSVETARRGGYLAAVPIFPALLVEALIERDELELADAELDREGWTGSLPDHYWWIGLLLSRGHLRLAQRRFDEALATFSEVERANERRGTVSPFRSVGSQLGLALAALDRRDEGLRAAETELKRARVWGTRSAIGAATRVLGLVRGGQAGLELLAEAVTVLQGSAHRLEYMRALVDQGGALRRANRRAEARDPLHEALDLARRGGALALARRAHEELEATGERLRPLVAAGVESLTPSERRVAELAADGLSNREVAQALFLTVKTVETHLSHAYRKLGIRSRGELPEALAGD